STYFFLHMKEQLKRQNAPAFHLARWAGQLAARMGRRARSSFREHGLLGVCAKADQLLAWSLLYCLAADLVFVSGDGDYTACAARPDQLRLQDPTGASLPDRLPPGLSGADRRPAVRAADLYLLPRRQLRLAARHREGGVPPHLPAGAAAAVRPHRPHLGGARR